MSCGPRSGAAGRPNGLWRQVLSTLKSPEFSDAKRQELLALGAAEPAWARTEEHRPVTATDVQRIAFEEFSLLLDTRQARAALRERRAAWHEKREPA